MPPKRKHPSTSDEKIKTPPKRLYSSTSKEKKEIIKDKRQKEVVRFDDNSKVKKCIDSIERKVNEQKNPPEYTESEGKDLEEKYKEWLKANDNSSKNLHYHDVLFRAKYVSELFQRRVETFYNLLKSNEDFKDPISKSKTIMSLGCGACPEIAAILHYYETDLKLDCKDLSRIIAVDKIDDWKPYHQCINDSFGINIDFQCIEIKEKNVLSLEQVDFIFMSYYDGEKSEDIWPKLKKRCQAIIILHNESNFSDNKLSEIGFKIKTFNDKDIKSYAYYTKQLKKKK